MTFSFFATPDFDFITQFAQHLQVPAHNDQLTLPELLGQGYAHRTALPAQARGSPSMVWRATRSAYPPL